jgi:hypothetical protein
MFSANENKAVQFLLLEDFEVDDVTERFIYSCTNLKIFVIMSKMSIIFMSHFPSCFQNLEYFATIDGCKRNQLFDDTLKSLGTYCKQLQTFRVYSGSNISDEGIKALTTGCKMLENILISEAELLTDESVFHISDNCLNLKEITIHPSSLKMTSDSIRQLVINCKKLTTLKLSNVVLNDYCMKAIASSHNLAQLNFFRCSMSSLTIKTLCSNSTKLENFEICDSGSILDDVILSHLSHNMNIKTIKFTETHFSFTDNGIIKLLSSCTKLISVCFCGKLLASLNGTAAQYIEQTLGEEVVYLETMDEYQIRKLIRTRELIEKRKLFAWGSSK